MRSKFRVISDALNIIGCKTKRGLSWNTNRTKKIFYWTCPEIKQYRKKEVFIKIGETANICSMIGSNRPKKKGNILMQFI